MKTNKYYYCKVIQQYYAASYGWEDVSEYETNSIGVLKDRRLLKHDVKEYHLLGYPTRVIFRKELV